VGAGALFLGRWRDALGEGKARGCCCVGSAPRVPWGDEGGGLGVSKAEGRPMAGFHLLRCSVLFLLLSKRLQSSPGGKGGWQTLSLGCLACAGTEAASPSATHPGAAASTFLGQEALGWGCGARSPSLLAVATWGVCT